MDWPVSRSSMSLLLEKILHRHTSDIHCITGCKSSNKLTCVHKLKCQRLLV